MNFWLKFKVTSCSLCVFVVNMFFLIGFDILSLPFAGGSRDPGRAGEVGASAEPAHSRAEKDPQ